MFKDFYHLKADPFGTHPNPGVIFISNTHKEAWYYLLFGIDTQEPFLVLTGDYGMGKTLLCLRLVQVLKKKGKPPVEYISTPGEGYGGILRRIAHRLNFSMVPEDDAILQDMVHDYFRTEVHDSKFYLIIDDAHELDVETLTRLKHLSSFNHNGFFPFVMVFVAHPSFLRGLQTPALNSLNQRIKRRYQLARFSFEDTKNYIYFRMLKSGAAGVPTFLEETFQKIYEFSGGVPRLINNICDTCLLIGASRELTVIPPSIVDDAKKLVEGSLAGTEDASPISESEVKPEALEPVKPIFEEMPPEPIVTISEELPSEIVSHEDSIPPELNDIDDDGYIHALPPKRSAVMKKLGTAVLMLVAAVALLICGAVLSQWYMNPDFTVASVLAGIRKAHTPPAVTVDSKQKPVTAETSPPAEASARKASAQPDKAPAAAPALRDESENTPSSPTVSGTSASPQTNTAPPASNETSPVQAQPAEVSLPATPKTEAPAEASHEEDNAPFGAYPFSLRASSYQQPSHALQEMSDIRKKGLPTYLVKVNLGDMGIWWRIYIGCYSSEAQARHVMTKYGFTHSMVEKTPYACLSGDYASEADIRSAFEKLKQDNFYPYVIQKGKDHLLLYVGAYAKKSDAEPLYQELQSMGFKSQIVTR